MTNSDHQAQNARRADGYVQVSMPRRVGQFLSRLGPLLGLISVWLLFASQSGQRFIAWDNHRLMLLQTAVVGTAAVGATMVIVSGGIDLSVGSLIALCAMVIATLLEHNWPPLLAALGGIVASTAVGVAIGGMIVGHVGRIAAVGIGCLAAKLLWDSNVSPIGAIIIGALLAAIVLAINEKWIQRIHLSPFIVTLGMWSVLRGSAKGMGDNRTIYPDQTMLNDLMVSPDAGLFSFMAPGVWLMLLTAACIAIILRYTRFGRYIFAIGSNEQTARLCGVDVPRMKVMIYAVAAACTGLAGVLQFAYLNGVGDPTTALGYELKVIAAVVIGGASLSGGEGSILGTLVGAMLMTVIDNGCTKLGLDNWIQEIVTGGIIVAAASLDRLRHGRSGV